MMNMMKNALMPVNINIINLNKCYFFIYYERNNNTNKYI